MHHGYQWYALSEVVAYLTCSILTRAAFAFNTT